MKKLTRRQIMLTSLAGAVLGNVVMHLRGYSVPGRSVVRCSRGHYFTTLWIVGASVKSLRISPRTRIMRCKECAAWRVIHPVKTEDVRSRLVN